MDIDYFYNDGVSIYRDSQQQRGDDTDMNIININSQDNQIIELIKRLASPIQKNLMDGITFQKDGHTFSFRLNHEIDRIYLLDEHSIFDIAYGSPQLAQNKEIFD